MNVRRDPELLVKHAEDMDTYKGIHERWAIHRDIRGFGPFAVFAASVVSVALEALASAPLDLIVGTVIVSTLSGIALMLQTAIAFISDYRTKPCLPRRPLLRTRFHTKFMSRIAKQDRTVDDIVSMGSMMESFQREIANLAYRNAGKTRDPFARLVRIALTADAGNAVVPDWLIDESRVQLVALIDDGCWTDDAPSWAAGVADAANAWRLVQAMETAVSMPSAEPDDPEAIDAARRLMTSILKLDEIGAARISWVEAEAKRKASLEETRAVAEAKRKTDATGKVMEIVQTAESMGNHSDVNAMQEEIWRLRAQLDDARRSAIITPAPNQAAQRS